MQLITNVKHDVHMRLEINGGRTEYDGVYAVSKSSTLSISKSKVSPIMNNFPIIIDITKGGVIDRAGSLVWWMSTVNPAIFKQAAWWSIEEWCYNKYKVYWDKFGLYKFRQSQLYSLARSDSNFVNFLQLIWLDLISERYVLQREVCKSLKDNIESDLMIKLGLSYDEINSTLQDNDQIVEDINSESLEELSDLLSSE